jgi:hypothetical protein
MQVKGWNIERKPRTRLAFYRQELDANVVVALDKQIVVDITPMNDTVEIRMGDMIIAVDTSAKTLLVCHKDDLRIV